jgi:DNA-binding NarL/FixJ family response regulator
MSEISPFDRSAHDEPPGAATRVLLVAGQELFRDVLRKTLSSVTDVRIVGESEPGAAALKACDAAAPDVVVIESEIGPDAEGVRSGYKIKAARPSVGIVVLATGLSAEIVRYLPARTGSGWSFLSRVAALDPQRLHRAISAAAEGHGTIDPGLERSASATTSPLLERLTAEQGRALELLAAGVSDAGIASRLDVTVVEAKRIVESLYDDMHITAGPRIDRRVVATLTFLRESVNPGS